MVTGIKKVDSTTRENLILLVYRTLPGMDYAQMHKTVKQFQNVLIEKYGFTLGYTFCDPSIDGCWDNKLQEDLEIYSGIEELVSNDDKPLDRTKLIYTHNLHINEATGGLVLDTAGRYNLEEKIFHKKGIIKELSKELKSIKQKCS